MPDLHQPTLSKKEDFWIRTVVIVLASIVGLSAGMLSWNGLTNLAINSGYEGNIVFFLPVAIDGLILLGVADILRSGMTGRSTSYGWTLNVIGGVLSIVGNIASSGPWGITSQIVHSIPPVALFLSIEVLSRVIKNRITDSSIEALEQQREQERELKRQQTLEARAIAKASTSNKKASPSVDTPTATPVHSNQSTAKPSSEKRVSGGASTTSRINADDVEVGVYKGIMDTLGDDASKSSKIEAVLMEHPEARNGHLALALGVEQKSVATTIVRIRTRVQDKLATVAGSENEDGVDTFHEIVKDFSVVNASSEAVSTQ